MRTVKIMGEPISSLPSMKNIAKIVRDNPVADIFILWAKGEPSEYSKALFELGIFASQTNTSAERAYVVTEPEFESSWRQIVLAKGIFVVATKDHEKYIRDIASLKSNLEHVFWRGLHKNKIKGVIPQFKLGEYRYDFGIPANNLLLEVDGFKYHNNSVAATRDAQKSRDAQSRGWTLFKFTDEEITYKFEDCIKAVKDFIG